MSQTNSHLSSALSATGPTKSNIQEEHVSLCLFVVHSSPSLSIQNCVIKEIRKIRN